MKLSKSLNLEGDRTSRPSWLSWRRWVIAVLFTMASGGNLVHAAIMEYNDASSFGAALESGSYLNDFTGAGTGSSLSFSGGTGPFAYTITASENLVTGVPMHGDSGLGTSVSLFVDTAALIITFTGANKPTAIGGNFFWSDLASPANVGSGTVRADFMSGGSSVYTLDVASSGNSSFGFGGISTDGAAFDSVTLTLLGYTPTPSTLDDFFVTVDNFNIGQVTPVPEPGGWVVAGFVGLLVLGRAGRGYLRRRSAARA